MKTKILSSDEALEFCDSIQLSDFTKIQPHGVLIVLNFDMQITYYSENISSFLGTSNDELLSHPISDFLSPTNTNETFAEYIKNSYKKYKQMLWHSKQSSKQILVYINRTANNIILEIEEDLQPNSNNSDLFNVAQTAIQSIKHTLYCHNLAEIADQACIEIKKITGYDRVIFYQFDKTNQSGLVLGESVNDDMDSYFGLHFPANDIPQNVRAMYLKESLRYIPSIQPLPISVIPNHNLGVNQPLDMSIVNLRMVAPVHVKYLHNMKVVAAVSVAIIIDNRLWGLIACHHLKDKFLSINMRVILQLISNTVAMQIMTVEGKHNYEIEQNTVAMQSKLSATFGKEVSLADAVTNNHNDIMSLVSSTGMSYYFQDILLNYGETPENEQVLELLAWLKSKEFPTIYATSTLPTEYSKSLNFKNKACGLLAIRITPIENHYILFYKAEQIHTIQWAGNPANSLSCSKETYSPRDSFQKFLQTISNQASPWTKADEDSTNFIRAIVSNRQLQDLLQVQAVHDPLTNLSNRLYLEQRLSLEIQRSTRYKTHLAVVIADLDRFKKVNDQYGHQAGDTVLIEFAKKLKVLFQGYDYIYRYGGEEFLIIMSNINTQDAVEKADNFRVKIKENKINFNGEEIEISVSLGIAMYPEHGTDARSLIAAADLALYKAKNNGRDQVCLAKHSTT